MLLKCSINLNITLFIMQLGKQKSLIIASVMAYLSQAQFLVYIVCRTSNILGIEVLGCQSVLSWLWLSKVSEILFFWMLYLMMMSWSFMIASSISSTVLSSVKRNYKSIWRMHNLMDAIDTLQMLMRDCTNALYKLDRKKILST